MSYFATVLADSPKGFWLLNELSGTNVADQENTSPGSYNGATLGQPPIATGLDKSIHAAGGYAAIPSTSAIQITGTGISLECWVNFDTVTTSGNLGHAQYFFDKDLNGSVTNTEYCFFWNHDRSDLPGLGNSLILQYDNPSATMNIHSVAWSPSASTAYHLVVTADGTHVTFFVNGTSVGQVAQVSSMLSNTQNVLIGECQFNSLYALQGYISDAAVYNYALSATQISNHYSVGTSPVGLVTPKASFATENSSIPVGYRDHVRDSQFPPKVTSPPTSNTAGALAAAATPGFQIGATIAVPTCGAIGIAPPAQAAGGTTFAGATASAFAGAGLTTAAPVAQVVPSSAISLAAVGDTTAEVAGEIFPGATGSAIGFAPGPVLETGIPGQVNPPTASALGSAPAPSVQNGANITPTVGSGFAFGGAGATVGAGSSANINPSSAAATAQTPRPTANVTAVISGIFIAAAFGVADPSHPTIIKGASPQPFPVDFLPIL